MTRLYNLGETLSINSQKERKYSINNRDYGEIIRINIRNLRFPDYRLYKYRENYN